MVEIVIDLLSDWTEIQRAALARMGYTLDPNETPETISLAFYNAQRREILPVRRTVFQSREFSCPIKYRSGLTILLKGAAMGLDLRSYQSKSLMKQQFDDHLLNDWRIHHFHLGTVSDPNDPKFVKRTKDILYAYLTDDRFYAIDVMKHGDWARHRLIEIVHRNWPELIAHYRVKGVKPKHNCSDSDRERLLLRSAGVVWALHIDDASYFPPGGGYASSRISIEVVQQHDTALRVFKWIQDYVIQNIEALTKDAKRSQGILMKTPFRIKISRVSRERIELTEVNSGAKFSFLWPNRS